MLAAVAEVQVEKLLAPPLLLVLQIKISFQSSLSKQKLTSRSFGADQCQRKDTLVEQDGMFLSTHEQIYDCLNSRLLRQLLHAVLLGFRVDFGRVGRVGGGESLGGTVLFVERFDAVG
jgi:hypothetical protein